MNAVARLLASLPRHMVVALSGRIHARELALTSTGELRDRLAQGFALDLAGFLNRARRHALERMAADCGLDTSGAVGELRARLWRWGAELEAGSPAWLGSSLQPVPIVLGGKLVHLGPARGRWPQAPRFPRPVPPPAARPEGVDEPECLEDLLVNADALVGVRLADRGRDKGAFGTSVAAMLGIRERGHAEPDWRGEVEIKTVPVVRDPAGWWRVKEDPAISMEQVPPLSKLARVLWIARVADGRESVILCWYYQERDPELRRLMSHYLHTRPKGRAGSRRRGWYLHKRFFVESGFLQVLNG